MDDFLDSPKSDEGYEDRITVPIGHASYESGTIKELSRRARLIPCGRILVATFLSLLALPALMGA